MRSYNSDELNLTRLIKIKLIIISYKSQEGLRKLIENLISTAELFTVQSYLHFHSTSYLSRLFWNLLELLFLQSCLTCRSEKPRSAEPTLHQFHGRSTASNSESSGLMAGYFGVTCYGDELGDVVQHLRSFYLHVQFIFSTFFQSCSLLQIILFYSCCIRKI